MRIGLNLLYLIPGEVGGTERYATALMRALGRLDDADSFYLFLNAESAELKLPEYPNFHRVVCRLRARLRPLRYLWEQLLLPFQVLAKRIDVLHSLGYVAPLRAPCRSVVTICDTNYASLGNRMPPAKRLLLAYFVRRSARRCDQVVTLSEFAARQIAADTRIPLSKITVTHLAGRDDGGDAGSVPWEVLEAQYRLIRPYIASFGSLSPHKNVSRLLDAFSSICGSFPHRLVLIGHIAEPLELTRRGLEGRVIPTGHVREEHVMPLLRYASLFVFPSLYEGFGLPVLEAQEAGLPVTCSAAGALPEIAGDSALFFDPRSIEDMAKALRTCLESERLRDELVRRGRTNLARFSWPETARKTLEVYRRLEG